MTAPVGWWAELFAEFALAADGQLSFAPPEVAVAGEFALAADAKLSFTVDKVLAAAEFALEAEGAGLEMVFSPRAGFGLYADAALSFTGTGHDGWTPGDEDGVTTLPHKIPFTLG
ncbi:hypothetical protein A5733_20875 [Mycobacterium sp. NS-7484]|uniref:hypothetical protein n=1 Tax=Mycobacterium sp. NS-7484 TaxID=1834161 RepID=UPI00096FC6E2|nr:hypothetical protein [Mycobacterium sp. NS-7484]OMC04905.1 hypothetical protein A5733_20875 [Mycobacterium sp. NS-7484]